MPASNIPGPPAPTAAALPPPAGARRPPRRRFRVVALLTGLFAGLIVAEIFLFITGLADPPRSKRRLFNADEPTVDYHCYSANHSGELEPLPDLGRGRWQLTTFSKREVPLAEAAKTPWCVRYRYSPLRTRGGDITDRPEPGLLRIAVVGDSFVFGEGVPEHRCLPNQLQALLGPRCELLNGGQVGANTAQEVAAVQGFVEVLHAPRVIVVWVPNDVELTPQLAARETAINDLMNFRDELALVHAAGRWYGFSRILRLGLLASDLRRGEHDTIAWYRDMYDRADNAENLDRLGAAFRQIVSLPGAQKVLVLYPLLEGLDGEYPLLAAHDTVAALAAQAGLPVLDLRPALSQELAGRATSTLWVDPTDRHPNGTAHAMAAAAISDWLRREHPAFLEVPAVAPR